MNPAGDATTRFSDRAEDYASARPGYPAVLFDYLMQTCALRPGAALADIGCGTGLSTRPWCDRGFRVFAIEPNREMRAAAARTLAGCDGLTLLEGTAENLPLADASVHLIVAAQAFHWFDAARARLEFARTLAPGGQVALIWNERDNAGSGFLRAYETLLRRHAPEYTAIRDQARSPRRVPAFFADAPLHEREFHHAQQLDLAALRRRLASASYSPAPGAPGHAPMYADLTDLFERHQTGGSVSFVYRTRVYHGRL